MWFGKFPTVRWAFGFHCRTTKLPIIYQIKNKKHWNLSNYIKKHVAPGSVMFSDEHPSYVVLRANRS